MSQIQPRVTMGGGEDNATKNQKAPFKGAHPTDPSRGQMEERTRGPNRGEYM